MLRVSLAITSAMLLLALADLPYGYYQMLRIITTGTLVWLTVQIWEESHKIERVALVLFAISYNPIYVIHMERDTHAIVNILTVLLIAVEYFRHRDLIESA